MWIGVRMLIDVRTSMEGPSPPVYMYGSQTLAPVTQLRERPVDFQGGAWYFQWSLDIFFSIFESLIIFFSE